MTHREPLVRGDQVAEKRSDGVSTALSRRGLLGAGLAGGAALALGAAGVSTAARQGTPEAGTPTGSTTAEPFAPPVLRAPLVTPEVRQSENGLLETTLTAVNGLAEMAGASIGTYSYDGLFPGPTLRFRPGDTVRVHLVNELDAMTNLHTHGLHVSPSGNSDNIFVHLHPGETFSYEYQIPENHPSGLFWYHPHAHGTSDDQVNAGMAGVMIIEGGLDEHPDIADLTDRVLILQATLPLADGNVSSGDVQTNDNLFRFVNGQLEPDIAIQPGETQRWRIANISADTFYLLALAGHQFHQISKDGNALAAPWTRDQILLSPGERVEVLVQAAGPGEYELRTLLWGTGFQSQPDRVLARMVVAGDPVETLALPTELIPFEDLSLLSDEEIDVRREITFSVQESPLAFLIDGQVFDENRVDQTVQLNAAEEWVLRNTSDEFHPFHIHVNEYQVVAINGEPYAAHSWEDTTPIPPNGEITIRTRFLDFTGKYVYHCHILFHENAGMMGVVEVVED